MHYNEKDEFCFNQKELLKYLNGTDYSPIIKEMKDELKQLREENISAGKDMEFVKDSLVDIKSLLIAERTQRKEDKKETDDKICAKADKVEVEEIKKIQQSQGNKILIAMGGLAVISFIAPFIWDLITK